MDFKLIFSQLSNQQKNPASLSEDLFEEISSVPGINLGKRDTIKLNSTSFPVIDPTEKVINKIVVSNRKYQKEPYKSEFKNQELDPVRADSIEQTLKNYREKWAIILGFFSFVIPGSGQALCNRLIMASVFLLLSVLCITASYMLTYRVLVGLLIIAIVSGIDEYRAVKKFNYLPYFKKFWLFPIIFLAIYAVGIYLALKRTWS